MKEKIYTRIQQRIEEIKTRIAKIEENKEKNIDLELWSIKELAYPEKEFFFVTEEGSSIQNEIEFCNFLKTAKNFKITKTYDYHY